MATAAATKPKPRATRQQAHRAAHAQPARRTRQTAAPARRKSGAAPRRAPARRPAPQRIEAGARIERLLEGRAGLLLDGLLRGRAWVVIIGALLAGIVFLNVSVLELNRGIASTTAKTTELERANSGLRARVATLGSSERIQTAAEMRGFIMPAPGEVKYLRSRPADAQLAAKRLATQSTLASTSTPAPASTTPAASAPAQTATQPQAEPVAQTTPQPAVPAAVATP
jgi:hypothetical protein